MGLPFFLFKPFIMNRLLLNLHVPDSIWGHVGNSFQEQLSISLMQRLLKQKRTKKTSRKLRTQYRMNELIMKWPSAVFYQNKLIAHHSVANNTLKDTSKCGNFLSLNPEIWNKNNTFLRYLFIWKYPHWIYIDKLCAMEMWFSSKKYSVGENEKQQNSLITFVFRYIHNV